MHPLEAAMGRTDPVHSIVHTETRLPDRNGWHTDDSYLERPPAVAILCCQETPEFGGDTAWANMQLAYERLSERMKALCDGLRAFHSTEAGYRDYLEVHLPAEKRKRARELIGAGATHPLIRSHPETGRKAVYFEPNFVTRIEGVTPSESRFLHDFLASLPNEISLQCRHRWRVGDVVIWDERMTQHSGAADHRGRRRVLRRCTVMGEVPHD